MFPFTLHLILTLLGQPFPEDVRVACQTPELARYCGIAEDVAHVTEHASRLPFRGHAAQEATAVALIGIAWHESRLRGDVQDCSYCRKNPKACDVGRSMSIYQLMRGRAWGPYSQKQICSSNRLATWLALRVLVMNAERAETPRGMFFGYASGDPGRNTRAGRELLNGWELRARANGLRVEHRRGALMIGWSEKWNQ